MRRCVKFRTRKVKGHLSSSLFLLIKSSTGTKANLIKKPLPIVYELAFARVSLMRAEEHFIKSLNKQSNHWLALRHK